MTYTDNELREKIKNKTDRELLKMVKIEHGDYTPETIKLAQEEISHRGILEKDIESTNNNSSVSLWYASTKEKGISIRWLSFYVDFLLPIGAIINVVSIADILSSELILIYKLLILYLNCAWVIFLIIVYLGLRRGRLWGYRLNFVLLFLKSISSAIITTNYHFLAFFFVFFIWSLPNAVYFFKRRVLFDAP